MIAPYPARDVYVVMVTLDVTIPSGALIIKTTMAEEPSHLVIISLDSEHGGRSTVSLMQPIAEDLSREAQVSSQKA